MDLFHGSDKATVKQLEKSQIKVNIGGGELGIGFYCGDLLYCAKAWAVNRYTNPSVLKIVVDDDDFLNLEPLVLNKFEAVNRRQEIRDAGETRIYEFKVNAVWAPVRAFRRRTLTKLSGNRRRQSPI